MENTKSKLTTAILAGAAIGGAIWYLTRTEHGKECLNAIVDTAKDYNDKIKDALAKKVEEAESISNKASEFMSQKASEATKYANEKLEDVNSKIDEATS